MSRDDERDREEERFNALPPEEDGLDPPGEQLELFPMPDVVETILHRADVYRTGLYFQWQCSCGHRGKWVASSGRANAGKRAHIVAVFRRNEKRP